MSWHVVLENEKHEAVMVNFYQIQQVNPKWRSHQPTDWPKQRITYLDDDYQLQKGYIRFIGLEEPAKEELKKLEIILTSAPGSAPSIEPRFQAIEKLLKDQQMEIDELKRQNELLRAKLMSLPANITLDASQEIITVGRHRIEVKLFDIKDALSRDDDLKGFNMLVSAYFPNVCRGKPWRHLSIYHREVFSDLMDTFIKHKIAAEVDGTIRTRKWKREFKPRGRKNEEGRTDIIEYDQFNCSDRVMVLKKRFFKKLQNQVYLGNKSKKNGSKDKEDGDETEMESSPMDYLVELENVSYG